jgi:carboxymethylenebutenolidase
MQKLGKTYEPVIYEGAGHGFMREGEGPIEATRNKELYPANKKAREEAWQRWTELLKKV